MLRYLLVLLTVIVAVLAVLFDHLWLRVGAGGAIVTTLVLLSWRFWEGYQEEEKEPRSTPEPKASGESLEELGIMDIRPEDEKDAEPEASSGSDRGESRLEGEGSTSTSSRSSVSQEPSASETAPGSSPSGKGGESAKTNGADGAEFSSQQVTTEDAPVLAPFLESLRVALRAQTVCLLVQEEVALTYHIEALASTHPHVEQSGSFDTQTPLLTASMSRKAVSVWPLTEAEVAIEDLGYYDDPPEVDYLAVAPVPLPDEPSTTFLLADAPTESDLGSSRARTLLEHFAETVALLSTTEKSRPRPDEPGAVSSSDVDASGEKKEEDEDAPRPRREIIAEEMEAAEAASEDLALILIHLNRAESIARRGEEAVVSAERLFRARLEQRSPNHRVERFGELTYGIFFRDGTDAVEPWVADLEADMAQEKGELEGGVSVGVAVWNDPNEDPEDLRAAATEALHEAYKTGTSTIVT